MKSSRLLLGPFREVATESSGHRVHVETLAADGHRWEHELADVFRRVLQRRDHHVVLPVSVGVGREQHGEDEEETNTDAPYDSVNSWKKLVEDVTNSMDSSTFRIFVSGCVENGSFVWLVGVRIKLS